MTDIVERLRQQWDGDDILCEDAADEIERLRAELELWKARAYAEGFVPAAERGA